VKIGLISDIHFGFHHGNKVNEQGVNVREQDFIDAGNAALSNLVSRGVDVIVDGGDMAQVPAPKKRAISALIDHVRGVDPLRYLSADGNHTSLKSTSDIHLYDILSQECPNFVGTRLPMVTEEGIGLVPHDYDPEIVKRYIEHVVAQDPILIVGHFAAHKAFDRQGYVDESFLPADIPVWLGHYHRHVESQSGQINYIGSTEHTAWDQWDYPTGATILDTDTGQVEYIEHPHRRHVDLVADTTNYVDVFEGQDLENAIVRLTITATPQEWNALDTKITKRMAVEGGALEYTQRRAKDKDAETVDLAATDSESIVDGWKRHVAGSDTPLREEVEKRGIEVLNG
jgi:DNA repair exonuclease SbcCD nuclease subunit